ncbi:efflux transporter outer membrane subunit [Flavobacterium degerlachei]|jgi:NodT family efflux transporter outer membrane factor (OMF) lipoprotein|uniref:Efflux transporter, outer membrane factor (OMF) lipoprotein, NodT family n=1 Tax=Flavobacterium degerlachei TaxID=229203 RepID=A0A1H2U7L2_9FLAO|nr:efflux transporter outer membrane subunit [Flavobacterium degerlachei]SDW51424.1 efflux transporter, outer membrane factor (OMF) lipoprotein, NodT family [Flavobacterium degerlachei]
MKNKIYKVALLTVTATVMQSCFVAKEYERPELKTENLYRNEVVSTDTTSLANVSWDKIFTDPLLQGYISKGLQNNLDIRIAMQNIAAAQATMKQGKAGYFPTLSASTDWTHNKISKNSQSGSFLTDLNTDQYQLYGSLSWEADIWGKIRSNKRATNAAYLQTTAVNQAIKTQLIANIATTYYQLLSVDAQIKVAEETLINRDKSVETILALKKAGNVTEVGVKQTEAQKYATEIIIADLKNSILILENTMSALLGEASAKIERSTFESQSLQPAITLGVSANLLRNRPDVIAAEYNLITNFEMTNVAKSGFYPSLKITATGGLQSIDLKEWFSANSLFANVITGLTQPIFNQRQVKTKYEIAQANQEKAYLQFEQSLLTAAKEVSDALAQYNNETYKISIRKKQADALSKASMFSDELLTYGLANYLEVLTAKDAALNSDLSLVDNKFQQYKAVIQLYRALGGGWQ